MKKLLIFAFAACSLAAAAQEAADSVAAASADIIMLDLSKATTTLEFDSENGSWTGTYDDDEESILSQCFEFVKGSMGDYNTWWGFTASNSTDNYMPENTLTQQWSNMAAGGIALNEDGTVKLDSFGAPVIDSKMPYLVSFCNSFFARHPASIVLDDENVYEPQGCYVNLNSYTFYSMMHGDGFARAFTNNDKLTLTIHGVSAHGDDEKTINVTLASFANGDFTASKGWKYVDLTSLGAVNEIWFSMTSTDSSAYGDNTPTYFCLDKLSVKKSTPTSAPELTDEEASLAYNRDEKTATCAPGLFMTVCDTTGNQLMSTDSGHLSLSSLPAGVYLLRAGKRALKIAK